VDEHAHLVDMDICAPDLGAVVRNAAPEVVFHQAAQIDVRSSVRDPLGDAGTNVIGTVNLLAACVEGGVRRVVFASTGGAIYGDTDIIPTPETHRCAPESPYGTAKLSAEAYGGTFERIRGLEFIALRYANVYGPRQDPHGEAGVVAIFATRLLRGEPCVINGDGRQTRDYVYVEDVVAANLRALAVTSTGVFNIGTGVETDVNGLHARMSALAGVTAEAQHGPGKPGEQQRSCLDIGLACQQLQWAPAVDLDMGLGRTLGFFRDH
jgi:UDP-glucose 4-epimerase